MSNLESLFATSEPKRKKAEIEKEFARGVNSDIVASMQPDFELLLSQLRTHIDQGEYGLIIGDDASGRIPALVMHEFINAIYDQRGYAHPKTLFIAGSRETDTSKLRKKKKVMETWLREQTGGLPKERAQRALIMTDIIETGESIEPICETLKKIGIAFDVATLALLNKSQQPQKRLGVPIVYASDHEPVIFDKEHLSGVTKEGEDLFASPVRKVAESKATAREAARALADSLASWYGKKEASQEF